MKNELTNGCTNMQFSIRPLHVACMFKAPLDVIEYLVLKGANPTLKNEVRPSVMDLI